jgi:hypothetical protein
MNPQKINFEKARKWIKGCCCAYKEAINDSEPLTIDTFFGLLSSFLDALSTPEEEKQEVAMRCECGKEIFGIKTVYGIPLHEIKKLIDKSKEKPAPVLDNKDYSEGVRGALARGYCTSRNSVKIVDPDLIEDMAKEIMQLVFPAPVLATEDGILDIIRRVAWETPVENAKYYDIHYSPFHKKLAHMLVGKVASCDANKKIAELEEWKRKVREEAPNDRAED